MGVFFDDFWQGDQQHRSQHGAVSDSGILTWEELRRGCKGWVRRYGTAEVSQFWGAEEIARRWEITREDMEEFALASHQRAIRATDEGRFETQIVPINGVAAGEGPRRDTSLEKMSW